MDLEYQQASENQPEIESPQPSAERNSGPEPKRSSSVLTYEHFIKTVHTRLGNDWDISLGICGEEGVGMFSTALRLGSQKDLLVR